METTSEYSSPAKAHSINTKALLLCAGGWLCPGHSPICLRMGRALCKRGIITKGLGLLQMMVTPSATL